MQRPSGIVSFEGRSFFACLIRSLFMCYAYYIICCGCGVPVTPRTLAFFLIDSRCRAQGEHPSDVGTISQANQAMDTAIAEQQWGKVCVPFLLYSLYPRLFFQWMIFADLTTTAKRGLPLCHLYLLLHGAVRLGLPPQGLVYLMLGVLGTHSLFSSRR